MKKINIIIASIIFPFYLFGAYLKNVPVTITQPNGATIECFATGDEFYNWAHDKDGYTIMQDNITGYYCYAILSGDSLVASQYVVGTVSPNTLNIQPHTNISAEKMREKVNAAIQNMSQNKIIKPFGTKSQTSANFGTLNNIVIYIRFADQPEFPAQQQTYTNLFNNNIIYVANSMRSYFKVVTYNQLDIVSHFYPLNNGTTILSYQDSYNRDYYCRKSATNPNGYTDPERINREHTLLYNAINYIKYKIPPSLNIDNNNDGRVDNVCFIVQGGDY